MSEKAWGTRKKLFVCMQMIVAAATVFTLAAYWRRVYKEDQRKKKLKQAEKAKRKQTKELRKVRQREERRRHQQPQDAKELSSTSASDSSSGSSCSDSSCSDEDIGGSVDGRLASAGSASQKNDSSLSKNQSTQGAHEKRKPRRHRSVEGSHSRYQSDDEASQSPSEGDGNMRRERTSSVLGHASPNKYKAGGDIPTVVNAPRRRRTHSADGTPRTATHPRTVDENHTSELAKSTSSRKHRHSNGPNTHPTPPEADDRGIARSWNPRHETHDMAYVPLKKDGTPDVRYSVRGNAGSIMEGPKTPHDSSSALSCFAKSMLILHQTKLRIIANSHGFRQVPKQVLEDLAESMNHVIFTAGEVIVTKGDSGDCMFFIANGEVHVMTDGPSAGTAPIIAAKIQAGEYFGEFCIFSGGIRSATCIAASQNCDCFTLDRETLLRVSNTCEVLRVSLEEAMFTKLIASEYPREIRKRPDIVKAIRDKTAEHMKNSKLSMATRSSGGGGTKTGIAEVKLEKQIGRGASGEVWFGMDENGRPCAVKRIATHSMSSRNIAQVQQEVSILEILSHANIVESYGTYHDNTKGYIHMVMEYLPMGSLQLQLSRLGPFKEAQARAYIKQMLTGLQYLHSRSILHRDIKPANALISAKGVVKLADFGICLQSLTLKTMTLTGTPAYLSPEVVEIGTYSVGSDIWAIGCTLLELVTGYPPWMDQTSSNEVTALIFRIANKKIPTIPPVIGSQKNEGIVAEGEGLSALLHDLILKMLNIDSTQRGSCDDLLQHPWFQVDSKDLPKVALQLRMVLPDLPHTVSSLSVGWSPENPETLVTVNLNDSFVN